MMDFDEKALDIAAKVRGQLVLSGLEEDTAAPMIAAALREAYNAGLELGAVEIEKPRSLALTSDIAALVRAKKVPT